MLEPTSTQDTVRVTARTPPSHNYVLGAAEMASTNRSIKNVYDAIVKLRPQILGDRFRCPQPEPRVQNVWINGRRVFFDHRRDVNISRAPTRPGDSRTIGPPTVESVLMSVKPEHVREIRYTNCWDSSMGDVGTDNAVFVTLVPGADWALSRGSYLVGSPDRLH